MRTDLRVLLLVGPHPDPVGGAWAGELARTGVPFDVRRPDDVPLSEQDLLVAGDRSWGRYQAVVLAADSSLWWGCLDALSAYRRRFGVRLVRGFEFPRPQVGLAEVPGEPMGQVPVRVLPTAGAPFGYLAGPFSLDPGCFGYPATPHTAGGFRPLLVRADGAALVGIFTDGPLDPALDATASDAADRPLEDLIVTVNYHDAMLHWRLLSRGLLAWACRGVHLGLNRHHLGCQVDDVFLGNRLDGLGADHPAPTVRMDAADVAAVRDWQRRRRFVLDLAFNGSGADPSGADPLSTALLEHRREFRWINHTWGHLNLDGMPAGTIAAEIEVNRRWAAGQDLAVEPAAVVTGAHSGLDNPELAHALARSGTLIVAADASRQPAQRQVGPALTAPRHPTDVYTTVTTWDEQLQEYQRRYGGPPTDRDGFLRRQCHQILLRILGNDPRPVFAHQSNLTGERVLLDLLDVVLRSYRRLLAHDVTLLAPTLGQTATELRRQHRWRSAVADGLVQAWTRGRHVDVTCAHDLHVPITVPRPGRIRRPGQRDEAFGQPYAGAWSAWRAVPAGGSVRVSW